jgi:ABC-2 type transport system ATP-binding protein
MVEFAVDGRTGAVDPEALRHLHGVRSASREGDRIQLQVSQLHEAVPALLGELARRQLPLTELSTHSATLEDVFVSLTGRHLRDE